LDPDGLALAESDRFIERIDKIHLRRFVRISIRAAPPMWMAYISW